MFFPPPILCPLADGYLRVCAWRAVYDKLGYQWATSLLAFLTVAMAPFPYVSPFFLHRLAGAGNLEILLSFKFWGLLNSTHTGTSSSDTASAFGEGVDSLPGSRQIAARH